MHPKCRSFRVADRELDREETVDLAAQHVAGHDRADAGGGSREDQIARAEMVELRDG